MSLGYRRGRLVLSDDPLPPPMPRSDRAAQIDEVLRRGGDLQTMARQLGITIAWLRRVIREREQTGEWEFVPTAGHMTKRRTSRNQ